MSQCWFDFVRLEVKDYLKYGSMKNTPVLWISTLLALAQNEARH